MSFGAIQLVYYIIRYSIQYAFVEDGCISQNMIHPCEIGVIVAFQILQYMSFVVDDVYFEFMIDRYQRLKEVEKQWFECLQNFPNGILLYDREKKKVIFENTKLNTIFPPTTDASGQPEDKYAQKLVMKMTEEQQRDLMDIKSSQNGIHLDSYIEPKTFKEIIELEAANCSKCLFFKAK